MHTSQSASFADLLNAAMERKGLTGKQLASASAKRGFKRGSGEGTVSHARQGHDAPADDVALVWAELLDVAEAERPAWLRAAAIQRALSTIGGDRASEARLVGLLLSAESRLAELAQQLSDYQKVVAEVRNLDPKRFDALKQSLKAASKVRP